MEASKYDFYISELMGSEELVNLILSSEPDSGDSIPDPDDLGYSMPMKNAFVLCKKILSKIAPELDSQIIQAKIFLEVRKRIRGNS